MPLLILIFFGLYGWIEFEALIVIGNTVGGLITFLGIFVTAFIGVALMRHQGISVIQRWQSGINEGEINKSTIASGLSLLLGSVLMLLPGYITDFIGLICFIPGPRTLIGKFLLSHLSASVYSSGLFSGFSARFGSTNDLSSYNEEGMKSKTYPSYVRQKPLEEEIIEGQYETKDNPKK